MIQKKKKMKKMKIIVKRKGRWSQLTSFNCFLTKTIIQKFTAMSTNIYLLAEITK